MPLFAHAQCRTFGRSFQRFIVIPSFVYLTLLPPPPNCEVQYNLGRFLVCPFQHLIVTLKTQSQNKQCSTDPLCTAGCTQCGLHVVQSTHSGVYSAIQVNTVRTVLHSVRTALHSDVQSCPPVRVPVGHPPIHLYLWPPARAGYSTLTFLRRTSINLIFYIVRKNCVFDRVSTSDLYPSKI